MSHTTQSHHHHQHASPTVNPKEMEMFKNMGAKWCDEHHKPTSPQNMNCLRVPWIVDGAVEAKLINKEQAESSKPLQGLKVLDVGCGVGILSEALAELGGTIIGIDPCGPMIDEAKRHQELNKSLTNLTYFNESVEQHTEHNSEKYGIVIASEVIFHVDEQDLFLDMCSQCVAPGGAIFITTFNQTWTSWFVGIVLYEYVWRVHRGCHSWYKFITPENVQKILKKNYCRTKHIRGIHLSFPGQTWSWSDSIAVRYGLCAVKQRSVTFSDS